MFIEIVYLAGAPTGNRNERVSVSLDSMPAAAESECSTPLPSLLRSHREAALCMKPFRTLAETRTPDGSRFSLHEHDGDVSLKYNGTQLMTSGWT